MASRKLIVEIVGDSRSLERTFGRVESRSERFSRRLKTGAKAGLVGAGIGAGLVVTDQLKKSVEAALDAEKAQTRLRSAFRKTGASQKDLLRAQKEISKVSRESALDDEELSDALASITRTTGSVQKGYRGIALAANIARARGISLAAATKIVEKAHVGQLRGLKSVGVQIDKNTTGAEALERAQRKFSGASAQFGQTAAGAQERLNVAFENLQETVGTALLPTLTKLSIKLTEIIESIQKNWPEIERVIKDSFRVVKPIIDKFVTQIKGIANVIEGVVKIIRGIKDGEWSQVWDGIHQVVVDGIGQIIKSILELPAKLVRALGSGAFDVLKRIGSTIKDAALAGLEGLADGIVSLVQGAINRLIKLLNKAVTGLNKIPLLPDIPKIPEIQSGVTAARNAARSRPTAGAVPQVAIAGFGGFTIENIVHLDGEEVGRNQKRVTEKDRRRNPRQKRGPNSAFR